MSYDETGRYIHTATVVKDVYVRGASSLVIRLNEYQTMSVDLKDDELRNVRDAINKYLGES